MVQTLLLLHKLLECGLLLILEHSFILNEIMTQANNTVICSCYVLLVPLKILKKLFTFLIFPTWTAECRFESVISQKTWHHTGLSPCLLQILLTLITTPTATLNTSLQQLIYIHFIFFTYVFFTEMISFYLCFYFNYSNYFASFIESFFGQTCVVLNVLWTNRHWLRQHFPMMIILSYTPTAAPHPRLVGSFQAPGWSYKIRPHRHKAAAMWVIVSALGCLVTAEQFYL